MTNIILTLNAGSSSIKFAAFEIDAPSLELLASGQIEGIGAQAKFMAKTSEGGKSEFFMDDAYGVITHKVAMDAIVDWLLDAQENAVIIAVGHRVVHGGEKFSEPVIITSGILKALRAYEPLAPLHQPHNLAGVEAALSAFPRALQVACFDTAFHRTHPFTSDSYALPRHFYDEGIRRYGFHGLSYEYIARCLQETEPQIAQGRVIVAHFGNGSSLCAMRNGLSVASTMGFSPLDGMPMGTRCGQIDPGVIFYLMQTKGMALKEVFKLLYHESGLKGMSGLSHDMRVLEASDAVAAQQAIAYFVARAQIEIAGLTATLGGLDALVFTAGIGENGKNARACILEGLHWMGLRFDEDANKKNARLISTPESNIAIFVLPTNEERMIAEHTAEIIKLTVS